MDFKPYTEIVLSPRAEKRERPEKPRGVKVRQFQTPKGRTTVEKVSKDEQLRVSMPRQSTDPSTRVAPVGKLQVPADAEAVGQRPPEERAFLPIDSAKLESAPVNPPREVTLAKKDSPVLEAAGPMGEPADEVQPTPQTLDAPSPLLEDPTLDAKESVPPSPSVLVEVEPVASDAIVEEAPFVEGAPALVEMEPESEVVHNALPEAQPNVAAVVVPENVESSPNDTKPVKPTTSRRASPTEPYRDFIISYEGAFIGHYRSACRITNRTALQNVARVLISAVDDLEIDKLRLYKPVALNIEIPETLLEEISDGQFQWFSQDDGVASGA